MKLLRKTLLALAVTMWLAPLALANPAPQAMDGGIALGKGEGKPTPTPIPPKPLGPPKSEGE